MYDKRLKFLNLRSVKKRGNWSLRCGISVYKFLRFRAILATRRSNFLQVYKVKFEDFFKKFDHIKILSLLPLTKKYFFFVKQ